MRVFDFTVETEKSVAETVAALEDSLQQRKFGVLWKFDLQSKLQEKGIDFTSPYFILEVCNPVQAKRALDETLLAGYLLPCKLVVYQEQMTTKIGLTRPTVLMGVLDNAGLAAIAQDVEEELRNAMLEAQ